MRPSLRLAEELVAARAMLLTLRGSVGGFEHARWARLRPGPLSLLDDEQAAAALRHLPKPVCCSDVAMGEVFTVEWHHLQQSASDGSARSLAHEFGLLKRVGPGRTLDLGSYCIGITKFRSLR